VNEEIEEQSKLSLESDDSKWRGIEFNLLLKPGMRRMVARQNVESAISDAFEERIDIALRPKWRIHLEVRVEVLNRFVR